MKKSYSLFAVAVTIFIIHLHVSYFVCMNTIGFGFWTIVSEMAAGEDPLDGYGRLGGGQDTDLRISIYLWVGLQLPLISAALILTGRNPHGVWALVLQIPFALLFLLQIFVMLAELLSIVIGDFANNGMKFQGSVGKLFTIFALELWCLTPAIFLIWEKLQRRRRNLDGLRT